MRVRIMKVITALMISLILAPPVSTFAYDLNEKLSLEATITGVYQYYNRPGDADDPSRGVGVTDVGLNFHPTENNEFKLKGSYTNQDGLNEVSPFSLVPYADDLRECLKHINSRDRSYLLEAWYKHKFIFSPNSSLSITGGIIDSTCYIDDNAFANDELTQFMNEIFVNHRHCNLPSYDVGGVAELEIANFSLRALGMASKNEENKRYNYYAGQLGYKADTPLGEGNYRIYGFVTSDKFLDWNGKRYEPLRGGGISLDQKLSEIIGVFARLGWQDDQAAIDYAQNYSCGLNINGKLWGRGEDEIGVGYAYLKGAGKSEIDHTHAGEVYTKFHLCDFSDITLDLQYMKDNGNEAEPRGFIYGVRLNTYF